MKFYTAEAPRGSWTWLHTEATHHVLWAMSDRGIPRSFRTMEGFGVHTFRLVNCEGETSLVKFRWKPLSDVHSPVWTGAARGGHGPRLPSPGHVRVQTPRMISRRALRESPLSFGDHFSRARMFRLSMTELERVHIIEAYMFEPGKVFEKAINGRTLGVLAQIDGRLGESVADGIVRPGR